MRVPPGDFYSVLFFNDTSNERFSTSGLANRFWENVDGSLAELLLWYERDTDY